MSNGDKIPQVVWLRDIVMVKKVWTIRNNQVFKELVERIIGLKVKYQ